MLELAERQIVRTDVEEPSTENYLQDYRTQIIRALEFRDATASNLLRAFKIPENRLHAFRSTWGVMMTSANFIDHLSFILERKNRHRVLANEYLK